MPASNSLEQSVASGGYNPALDGVRAAAVALVIGFHAFVPRLQGGYLGVDIFFVLSGFLISSLLIGELQRSGTIDVARFYGRRLIRLTPALLFMLGVYLVVAPFAWPEIPGRENFRDAAIAATYFSDYSSAIWSIPVRLRHTWSLSVEEHFYLLWPLVLLIGIRGLGRRRFAAALIASYIAATAWRVYCDLDNGQGYDWTYYRFDTRLSGLIAGSFLATIQLPKAALPRLTLDLIALLAVLLVGICSWRFAVDSTLAVTLGMTCIEWATIAGLFALVSSRETIAYKVFSTPPVVFIGKMSYGIYLWHYPIFRFLWSRDPWYFTVLIGGFAALVMAVISSMTIERYARERFGIGLRERSKADLVVPDSLKAP